MLKSFLEVPRDQEQTSRTVPSVAVSYVAQLVAAFAQEACGPFQAKARCTLLTFSREGNELK
ncbi:MAG: hypothetical protein JOZ18_23475 [Chloroflexi bacterium]|nr:hypothetical protein [Chloroflexota bacterium]